MLDIFPRYSTFPEFWHNHSVLTEPQAMRKPSDTSSALANHCAKVYQAAYLEILRSAIGATGQQEGFIFNDGTVFVHIGVFNILIAILDYEEVYGIMLNLLFFTDNTVSAPKQQ